jgi:hypothetical protein
MNAIPDNHPVREPGRDVGIMDVTASRQARGGWRESVFGFTRKLTIKGFFWSIALPALALILFYAVVGYPQQPGERWSTGQDFLMVVLFGLQILSLWIVPGFSAVCLFIREWRHVSVYLLVYLMAALLVRHAVFLARPEFFNQFF